MNFRLVDSGWDKILDEALAADKTRVRIIYPFIKEPVAKRLLQHGRPKQLEVITRYDIDCFRDRVSDMAALRLLFQAGAKIRGIKHVHAKVYLIGRRRASVTSANLTEQGLIRNHEFGFYTDDEAIAENCHTYFDKLWKQAGRRADLTLKKLDGFDRKVTAALVSGAGTRAIPSLGDEGQDIGFPGEPVVAPRPAAVGVAQTKPLTGIAATRAQAEAITQAAVAALPQPAVGDYYAVLSTALYQQLVTSEGAPKAGKPGTFFGNLQNMAKQPIKLRDLIGLAVAGNKFRTRKPVAFVATVRTRHALTRLGYLVKFKP
jgi:hypothetical protein